MSQKWHINPRLHHTSRNRNHTTSCADVWCAYIKVLARITSELRNKKKEGFYFFSRVVWRLALTPWPRQSCTRHPEKRKGSLSRSLSPEIAESSALGALNADFCGLISVTGATARTSEKLLIKKKTNKKQSTCYNECKTADHLFGPNYYHEAPMRNKRVACFSS